MNQYQYQRLAAEFGVIDGKTLKAMMDGGMASGYIASACCTTPKQLEARIAFWQSEDAPSTPPTITVA